MALSNDTPTVPVMKEYTLSPDDMKLVNLDKLKTGSAIYDTQIDIYDDKFEADWEHDANGAFGPYDFTYVKFSAPIGEVKIIKPSYLKGKEGPFKLLLMQASKGNDKVEQGAQKFTIAL